MTENSPQSLLPEGLHDELPPAAGRRSRVISDLLESFARAGYEQVSPPLLEFEDSLLSGSGAAQARQTFRLMDPASHRMMAVRADMTLQIARIAATRLASAPRPLRLSYAGRVLRVKGLQFRPERELIQAGFELVGSAALGADLEVLLVAVDALRGLGIEGLSTDINLPPLVPVLCRELGASDDAIEAARMALDTRDKTGLAEFPTPLAEVLRGLIDVAGPVEEALAKLRLLDLPATANDLRQELERHIEAVRARAPELSVTVDLGDSRGFEYYTGIGFALFAPGSAGELGRGGRYQVERGGGLAETAAGFSVYIDGLMGSLPDSSDAPRVYLPYNVPRDEALGLRAEGWRAVQGLEPESDVVSEAKRLLCSHVWEGGRVVALDD